MVNLTKIYTRTGDDGTTSLGDFSRTSKNDPRLHAYADTNEAMRGNICRCGAYCEIRKAIHRAADIQTTGAAK